MKPEAALSYSYHVIALGWKTYGAWRKPDGSTRPCLINPAGDLVEYIPSLPVTRRNAILAIRHAMLANPNK